MVSWIWLAGVTSICNGLLPTFTPVLNQYAYGSGVVGSYFLFAALVGFIVYFVKYVFAGAPVVTPSIIVMISGLIYGAGTLSIQKANERAPTPALATLLPRNRAALNALIGFVAFGLLDTFGNYDVFFGQLVLAFLLIQRKTDSPETQIGTHLGWFEYSLIAMILLSVSDVLIKQELPIGQLLEQYPWFALFGAIIPLITQYRKTNEWYLQFREKNREGTEKDNFWVLLVAMCITFTIKLYSQYGAISMAPDSTIVRVFTSFSVPLTVFFSKVLRNISHSSESLQIIAAISGLSLMGGIRAVRGGL